MADANKINSTSEEKIKRIGRRHGSSSALYNNVNRFKDIEREISDKYGFAKTKIIA